MSVRGRLEFVARILEGSPKLSSIGLAFSWLIFSFIQKNISTCLRVCSSTICTKFNVQIEAGRHLKGFGLAYLSEARRGYMPPRLKTNKTSKFTNHLKTCQENVFLKLVLLRKFHCSTHCTGGLYICTTADFSTVKVLQSHASILVTADREGQKTNR